uniref:Uncharacterized protein n=1 Tax=Meloidogyne javanica TaxID=6303 RepID=A0A915LTV4_MELJA
MKAHFLKDNKKVEEKYIRDIKQMISDYIHFEDEKDKKITEGREEYNKLLEVLQEKYKIWNEIYKKEFDKDEVEINKEIRRLNEEFEKYQKAYEDAYNLIETKTLASPSHKGSRRRGSREFSIGSNEDLRSTRSGEVSVYSHNSNESGNSDRSTSSASRRLFKSAGKQVKKVKDSTALIAKGIPGRIIGKNLKTCENKILPMWIEINKEIGVINQFLTVIF